MLRNLEEKMDIVDEKLRYSKREVKTVREQQIEI